MMYGNIYSKMLMNLPSTITPSHPNHHTSAYSSSAFAKMLAVYSTAAALCIGGGGYCLWQRRKSTVAYKKPISVNYHFTRKVCLPFIA